MARVSDMPCAICGRPMWRGGASLPEGQATCHPCRRKSHGRGPDERGVKPSTARWVPQDRECLICGSFFTQERARQVYCSASCRESRRNWSNATKAASAEERGYGKAHREERARWKPIVEAGRADCCICGYWIEPGTAWHLDHTEDRTSYRGVAHSMCNVRDGARRGARRTNATRQIEKRCATCSRPFVTPYPKQTYCSVKCRPKVKAKPRRAAPPRYCVDCGAATKGKRCAPCGVIHNGIQQRNRYRSRVGIPLDAPLWRRAS